MRRGFRMALAAGGGLAMLFALGFLLQAPWATGFWPAQSGRLSNIFVASILAAIGAPVLWIAATGEGRAIAGGAANLLVTNLGCAGVGLWSWSATGNSRMLAFALACAAGALVFLWLFRRWHRAPFRDTRPMPRPVRLAFAVFAALLVFVALRLILVLPNTFPWPLGAENSLIYGFIFLGASVYFLYGLRFPVWGNAAGQMAGFLAYDLVLIVPFLRHFATVQPTMLPSLTIYTAVVSLSGLLAIWYLLLDPATRLGSSAATAPVA